MGIAREKADAFAAAYNAHDLDKALAFFRPDATFVSPDAGELKGIEQIKAYHQIFFDAFPDAYVDVLTSYEDGHVTFDEWIFRGTHTGPLPLPNGETLPPTGRRIAVRGSDVGVHDGDGVVVSQHMYFDQMQLARELGVLPE